MGLRRSRMPQGRGRELREKPHAPADAVAFQGAGNCATSSPPALRTAARDQPGRRSRYSGARGTARPRPHRPGPHPKAVRCDLDRLREAGRGAAAVTVPDRARARPHRAAASDDDPADAQPPPPPRRPATRNSCRLPGVQPIVPDREHPQSEEDQQRPVPGRLVVAVRDQAVSRSACTAPSRRRGRRCAARDGRWNRARARADRAAPAGIRSPRPTVPRPRGARTATIPLLP